MSTVLPPLRSALPAVDLLGFLEAVQQALALHIKASGAPEGKAPLLVHDFPRTREGHIDTAFDLISFHVVSSERAGTDPSGRARIPNGPQLRQDQKHPGKAGYRKETWAWTEDAVVQFTVWAKSNHRAEALANWFHRFMMTYTWVLKFFKARGIELLVFEKRVEDKVESREAQELYTRGLQYRLRIECLFTLEAKELEFIREQITNTTSGETDTIDRAL